MQVGRWLQDYRHTLHTGTPGAMNMGSERTAKGQYVLDVLVLLRVADVCGQAGERVETLCFAVTASERNKRDICSWTVFPRLGAPSFQQWPAHRSVNQPQAWL